METANQTPAEPDHPKITIAHFPAIHGMGYPVKMSILDSVRKAAHPTTWSAAVRLVRQDCVRGESEDEDEVILNVRVPGRPIPFEVYLWPQDNDWGCDCPSRAPACVHAAAAAIAWSQAKRSARTAQKQDATPGQTSPSLPRPRSECRVRHVIERRGKGLEIIIGIVHQDATSGREEFQKLSGSLSSSRVWAGKGDLKVEAALATCAGRTPPPELWPRILRALSSTDDITLDGQAVRASSEEVAGVLRIEDIEGGFRARLVRDPRIDEHFACGVVICGNVLHPLGYGGLDARQRQVLLRGIDYTIDEAGRLVGELLPSIDGRIPIDIRSHRLPRGTSAKPSLRLEFTQGKNQGLRILPLLVYGDPPLARVDGNRLVCTGRRVPVRNFAEEDRQRRKCGQLLGVAPGRPRDLTADEAVHLVSGKLGNFKGQV